MVLVAGVAGKTDAQAAAAEAGFRTPCLFWDRCTWVWLWHPGLQPLSVAAIETNRQLHIHGGKQHIYVFTHPNRSLHIAANDTF